jgi:hypothetical protein
MGWLGRWTVSSADIPVFEVCNHPPAARTFDSEVGIYCQNNNEVPAKKTTTSKENNNTNNIKVTNK